jgi:outer membrane biosynthesis protein TonB
MRHFFGAATLGCSVLLASACASSPAADAAQATSARAASTSCDVDVVTVDTIYADAQVDEQAKPRRGNPEIPWPSESTDSSGIMLSARVREATQGEVVLRFVVDYRGCPDMRTVRVISATDSAFAGVVRQTLPRWRFDPARKDGRNVSQVLQWKWVLYRRAGARVPGTE